MLIWVVCEIEEPIRTSLFPPMAGNSEMNGGKGGTGHVEVGSHVAANFDNEIIGAQSEQPLQALNSESEPAPVIAISESPASSTIAPNAASQNHEETSPVVCTKTTEAGQKPADSGLNANAAPWSSSSQRNRAILSRAWKLGLGFHPTKKLLILDVNGLLVARYTKLDRSCIPHGAPHGVVAKSYMFKRPFCDAFLRFCFENFHVGVWSSMMETNVTKALGFILGSCKEIHPKFAFVMHQGDCTATGLRNPEKKTQPLFLKELWKVWSKYRDFNESNTLLIDDTPYKALRNPPYTAIFPEAYLYDEGDTFLKGALVEYLTQLRDASDVQEFVRTHPIGIPAIAPGCLHWNAYRKVLKTSLVTQAENINVAPLAPVTTQIASPMLLLTRLENLSLAEA